MVAKCLHTPVATWPTVSVVATGIHSTSRTRRVYVDVANVHALRINGILVIAIVIVVKEAVTSTPR